MWLSAGGAREGSKGGGFESRTPAPPVALQVIPTECKDYMTWQSLGECVFVEGATARIVGEPAAGAALGAMAVQHEGCTSCAVTALQACSTATARRTWRGP